MRPLPGSNTVIIRQNQQRISNLLVLFVGGILLGQLRGSRNPGSGQIGPGRDGLGGNHGGILGGRVHGGIDPGFVLLQEVLEERIVQELGAAGLRGHAPDEEGRLEGVVERDPIQEEVDKDLDDGEEGVHHPVDEPLGIVSAGLRLDGLEGLKGRVDEADDIAESSGTDTEEQDEEHKRSSAEGDVLLGDLGHVLFGRGGGGGDKKMDGCEGNGLGVVHRTANYPCAIAALHLMPFSSRQQLQWGCSLACGPIQIHQGGDSTPMGG